MDGNKLADAITNAVNSGIDESEFRQGIQQSHNALQRYAYNSVLKQGIIALASTPYTDARNKQVVYECQEVCESMGWKYDE